MKKTMAHYRTFGLAGFLTLGLFLSCTGDESPSGLNGSPYRATLAIAPTFPVAAATAHTPPIVSIRATVTVDPPGAVIYQETFSVDPDASEWQLDLEIPLSGDSGAQYTIDLELLDASGGVVWSARLGPLTIVPGLTTDIREVLVGRGPLNNIAVTGLSLSGPSSVPQGESFGIESSVQTSDGSQATVIWTSLTPGIASISDAGVGTALAPGTAEIEAAAGQFAAVHSFEVIGVPADVVISPESATLTELGQTALFDAMVVDSRGNNTGDAVIWSVEDNRIVANLGGGAFEAVGGGETTVHAEMEGNPELHASASVVVDLVAVEIFVDPDDVLLTFIGATQRLSVTGVDVQGAQIFGLRAAWNSSNPAVVSVDEEGTVTGRAVGAATVTAEVEGLTAEASVTVSQVVTSLTIEPLETTLTALGQTVQHTAAAQDAGGSVVPGAPFEWMSGNNGVATIDNMGLATAVGNGETEITVSSEGASASASVRVVLPLNRVEISPRSATIEVGDEARFTARAFDASDNEVPGIEFGFESSNTSVLIVLNEGLAVGNTVGEATVTATEPGGLSASAEVTVVPASLQPRIRFQVQPPSSAVANSPFSPPVSAEVLDVNGQRDVGFGGLIEITLTGGNSSAQLIGTTIESVSSGLAVFSNMGVDLPGTGYRLQAFSHLDPNELEQATSSSFDVQPQGSLTDQFYTTAGNTELIVGNFPGPSTAHIHDFTNPLGGSKATVTVTGTFLSDNGGTVDMQASGDFSYIPPAGFTAQDEFQLTTDIGIVTVFIDFLGMVWYVDGTSPGGSPDGTSAEPFPTIGDGTSAAGSGEIIYVLQSSYNEFVQLQAGQQLIGSTGNSLLVQPGGSGPSVLVDCDLCGEVFGSRPDLDSSMNLTADNTVMGFDLFGSLNASGATTLTTVSDVSVDGGNVGVSNGTGTFVFTNVDVTQSSDWGVIVSGGAPTVQFDGTVSDCFQFNILSIQNTTGGQIDFTGGPYTATAGCNATLIIGSNSDVSIDNLVVEPGGIGGVSIEDSNGNYTFTNFVADDPMGSAIFVSGMAPVVSVGLGSAGISGTVSAQRVIAVNGTTGGSVTVSGASITATGGQGVQILNTGGPVTVNSPVTITNPTLDALGFVNAADATFASFSATTSGPRGVSATSSPGTLTIQGGSITALGGTAVDITSTNLDMTLGTLSSTGDPGIAISQSSGTFSASGGVISGSPDLGVRLSSNPNLNFTYGGSVTLTGGPQSVEVEGNTGGTYSFTGPITSEIIFLNNNTGTTVNFSGGLDITTFGNIGFDAVDGGTVNVTGTGNTIDTQNATALRIVNTTIGASGVTFESISNSVNTGIPYMTVSNTGSGAFTITGVGATLGSGGVLTNGGSSFGEGLDFIDVQNVSLNGLDADGSEFDGLSLNNVTNATVSNSSFVNMGQGSGGDAIRIVDPSGTWILANVAAQSVSQDGLNISSSSGTATIDVTGSTIDNNSGNGISVATSGTANLSLGVDGNPSISNNGGAGVFANGVAAGPTSTLNLIVGGTGAFPRNLFDSNQDQILLQSTGTGADVFFDIDGNQIVDAGQAGFRAIEIAPGSTGGIMAGGIRSNLINGVGDAAGISVAPADGGSAIVEIDSNTIVSPQGVGIEIANANTASAVSAVDATLLNNAVQVGDFEDGVLVASWQSVSSTMCINLGGNVTPGDSPNVVSVRPATVSLGNSFVLNQNGTSVFEIQDWDGLGGVAGLEAFIDATNPIPGTDPTDPSVASGTFIQAPAACIRP